MGKFVKKFFFFPPPPRTLLCTYIIIVMYKPTIAFLVPYIENQSWKGVLSPSTLGWVEDTKKSEEEGVYLFVRIKYWEL